MKKFNSIMVKIAIIMAIVVVMALGAEYILAKNEYKANLFLEPYELIGTDEYHLASAMVDDRFQIVWGYDPENGGWHTFNAIEDIDENEELINFMRQSPGTYFWADWIWSSKKLQKKYEPIYGSGLWVYDPAD